jgi:hypothetical protein
MRVALYNGQKNIVMTELETPVSGENDIVVKNIYIKLKRFLKNEKILKN